MDGGTCYFFFPSCSGGNCLHKKLKPFKLIFVDFVDMLDIGSAVQFSRKDGTIQTFSFFLSFLFRGHRWKMRVIILEL